MALIGVLQNLVDGQVITAAQHNSNYGDIKTAFNTSAVLTDVAKTITVSHTWAASQTLAGATLTGNLLFTDNTYDIGAAGATRPRDLWLARNFTVNGSSTFNGIPTISAPTGTTLILDSLNNVAADYVNILFRRGGVTKWRVGVNIAGANLGALDIWEETSGIAALSFSVGRAATLTGNLLFTDATYDIGAAGATRPRDLFLSRDLTIGAQFTFGNGVIMKADPSLPTTKTNVYMPGTGQSFDFRMAADAGSALLILDTGFIQVSNGVLNAQKGIRTLYDTNANQPAAGAAQNGLVTVDNTNNRLIYYSGGLRYFIPIGTSF